MGARFDKIYKDIVDTIAEKEFGVKEMSEQNMQMVQLHIIKVI